MIIDSGEIVNHNQVMATFEQIKELRLYIKDPAGVIDLQEVTVLPGSFAPQTAYKLTTDGLYYLSASETAELRISDARISNWIDLYGVDKTQCLALKDIIRSIGNELQIIRINAGSEDTQYTTLKDTLEYYKFLYSDCKDQNEQSSNNSAGRYGPSKRPEIAGGNI